MTTTSGIADRIPFGRLAFVGTVGSLATCYLKIVFLVFVWLGATSPPDINPHLQAAIMTLLALVALLGLYLDRRRHGGNLPMAVGVAGVLIIVGTLYGYYRPEIEFTGYLVLIVAVFLNQNTQLKRLNATVAAMNSELEARARDAERASVAKSQFLANMSHELRTPLNAVIGLSEMLHEDAIADGDEERIEANERIVGAGRHLLALINDILDLSKIEAGRLELNIESVDVSRLMREVEMTARPLAEQNGNRLEVRCAEDVGSLLGDALRVRQAVLNLASNACKFTRDGRVRIDASREGGEWVRLRVEDTGIGIDPERLDDVFEEFSQVQHAGGDFAGTGLGLTISRRLCRLMGGDIIAQSTPGQGSTFTIRLPGSAQAPMPIGS